MILKNLSKYDGSIIQTHAPHYRGGGLYSESARQERNHLLEIMVIYDILNGSKELQFMLQVNSPQ